MNQVCCTLLTFPIWGLLHLLCASHCAAENLFVKFHAKDHQTEFSTEDAMKWRSTFSAHVQIDNVDCELVPEEGRVIPSTNNAELEMTPQGPANITSQTIEFPEHGVQLLFRLGRFEGHRSLLFQVGIKNQRKKNLRLISVTPIMAKFAISDRGKSWLLTALNDSIVHSPPWHSLDQISAPVRVRECGSIYRQDGKGFFFGPVGAPTAFMDGWLSLQNDDHFHFRYVADMSRVMVEQGETRWGQQVAVMMDPPAKALAMWADWTGVTHQARKKFGSLSGWNSWNFLGGKVTGTDILSIVDTCKNHSDHLRPQVIQIDGIYEDSYTDKPSQNRFPEKFDFYADQIADVSARPGILLEMSIKDLGLMNWSEAALRSRQFVDQGFRYIKINNQNSSWHPLPSSDRKTSFQTMRDGFSAIRSAVGDDVYLLNSDLRPNRAAIGYVDAQRVSCESKRENLRPTIDDALRNFHLQAAWGAIDADAYYLGTELENISSIQGGWPLVRTWLSMIGISGGTAITSDPWYWESFQPHLRNVETMIPPLPERATVLDLGTSRSFARIVRKSHRDWGDMTVALLWNPENAEKNITLNFSEANMNPDNRYAVWSFWDNRFLGVAKGSWITPSLAPSSSQHLRFTDLDRTPNRPVLIGSNLHISCGVAEIQQVTSLQGGMEIELSDAGARNGDLFVYSKLTPMLKSATGCKIKKIDHAGENVWRISLQDRQRGVSQKIEMSIQVPVIRQPWFWLLIVLAMSSLLYSITRYIANIRLEREHALQQERLRIAQDLHDHIGANLAQIGLLTEQVEQSISQPQEMRHQLHQIFDVSHSTARELDALVWAVNPTNDTLEEFARYIHGYAENYLAATSIRCHFTNAQVLPEIRLSSATRHHLLMIVKEALHNVVDHSGATLVQLDIGTIDQQIILVIKDNGSGFCESDIHEQGNGLSNIRSRCAEMGGFCEFLPHSPGHGTTVRISIPTHQ